MSRGLVILALKYYSTPRRLASVLWFKKDKAVKVLKEIQHHLKGNRPLHTPFLKVFVHACPVTVFLAQFSIGLGF